MKGERENLERCVLLLVSLCYDLAVSIGRVMPVYVYCYCYAYVYAYAMTMTKLDYVLLNTKNRMYFGLAELTKITTLASELLGSVALFPKTY